MPWAPQCGRAWIPVGDQTRSALRGQKFGSAAIPVATTQRLPASSSRNCHVHPHSWHLYHAIRYCSGAVKMLPILTGLVCRVTRWHSTVLGFHSSPVTPNSEASSAASLALQCGHRQGGGMNSCSPVINQHSSSHPFRRKPWKPGTRIEPAPAPQVEQVLSTVRSGTFP